MMKALVIGGTGPTGPYLVNGLVERGYDVSIMHRGTHDSDLIPASVERLRSAACLVKILRHGKAM